MCSCSYSNPRAQWILQADLLRLRAADCSYGMHAYSHSCSYGMHAKSDDNDIMMTLLQQLSTALQDPLG